MKYSFELSGSMLLRKVELENGQINVSAIERQVNSDILSMEEYENYWLRSKLRPSTSGKNGEIRVVDLFCGCGGLSLGIAEACRAMEYDFVPVIAADLAENAMMLYQKNFGNQYTIDKPIEQYIDSEIGADISENEKLFLSMAGQVDILIGGPPCQGNSDLNNHTRRTDPRNLLYLKMIRCTELVKPEFLVIENVPGVQHDKFGVVEIAKLKLKELGYSVDNRTIDMSVVGVPQKRKRFFLIASKNHNVSLDRAIKLHETPIRNLKWAIEDLLEVDSGSVFDTPANSSKTNKKRIDYLFDNDLYDLPNSQRPDCHRLKKHSYTSVYGRLYWDLPAPTITGGFGSNGQGRFVHSQKRRTITPHEAARIQFFPDYFDFNGVKRRELQQIIGNAVPPKASYIIGIEFLTNLCGGMINE